MRARFTAKKKPLNLGLPFQTDLATSLAEGSVDRQCGGEENRR
jgi:hypothetical protein